MSDRRSGLGLKVRTAEESIPDGVTGRDGLLLRRTECALQPRSQPRDSQESRAPRFGLRAGDRDPTWYALYTRSRHEKKVEHRLNQRQIEVFLPLVPLERRWHDRTTTVDWPMFPGYVFVRVRLAAIPEALRTAGVLTVIRHNGSPAPIRDKVIEDVRLLAEVTSETGALPEPSFLVQRGQGVTVTSGPLQGVEGVVVERRGGGRVLFQIGVEAIGQGLKVEVDASSVRVLEEAR